MSTPHNRTVLLKVGNSYANLLPNAGTWLYVSGEAQSGYSETFTEQSQVMINHNLGRTPRSVTVRTLGGTELDCEVLYLNVNQLLINFDSPRAGRIEIG